MLADNAAGLPLTCAPRHRFLIEAAPLRRAEVSMPATARGKRPTAEKTEYRPPTFFGMGILAKPSFSARCQSLDPSSVIATTRPLESIFDFFPVLFVFLFFPIEFFNAKYNTSKLETVSVVPPDLVIKQIR